MACRSSTFETLSNFYLIGRDKTKSCWRLLKISRLEPSELNVVEDPMTYSRGFIKLLGPYYMLIITERKKIGTICGHSVFTVTGTDMIPIPNVLSNMPLSMDEKRYKNLLHLLDLKKEFFFSYSYNVMCTLQKIMCANETEMSLHETMFVWNEYLTREIRQLLRSTLWTVALVYGFFKQVTLSVLGEPLKITLIARRSRHYAGTRYLKRGVNENGEVANDVETEQIITEDLPDGSPIQISSVVQVRGSIPLFWTQERSQFNLRPEIILSKKDSEYGATRLHFENLFSQYGNQILILDLIKAHEEKPRESVLLVEYFKAVQYLKEDLNKENRLMFYHLDLSRYRRNRGATNKLSFLCDFFKKALSMTGIFHHHEVADPSSSGDSCSIKDNCSKTRDKNSSENKGSNYVGGANENPKITMQMRQDGVLRTNCIDCIDRTNVAQYAYGLAALGKQLQALGLSNHLDIRLDDPLAKALMGLYEIMGDTLAQQYGGSAAHNKIFCENRGQWKPATQSQELLRNVQRYLSNTYTDPEKQDAIDIFLGHFQPQQGKSAIWERNKNNGNRLHGSSVRRSLSDGYVHQLCENLSEDITQDCQWWNTSLQFTNKYLPGQI